MSGGLKIERQKRTNVGDFALGTTGILEELTMFGRRWVALYFGELHLN